MSLWNDLNDFIQNQETPELQNPEKIPNYCESGRGLRQFLTHSRNLSDDVLTQRLNSALNHNETRDADKRFDKSSVCKEFIEKVLIKSWNERLKGLQFCGKELDNLEKTIKDIENTKIDDEGVDLTFDPYAIRNLQNLKEEKLFKYNNLNNFLKNEQRIESIIQGRSKNIIYDHCGVSQLIDDFINK